MSNTLNLTEFTDFITVILNGTAVTLDFDDLVQQISIKVKTGTCTVQGSGKWRNNASDIETLAAGDTLTATAKGPNAPIVGLVITAVGGITNLFITR